MGIFILLLAIPLIALIAFGSKSKVTEQAFIFSFALPFIISAVVFVSVLALNPGMTLNAGRQSAIASMDYGREYVPVVVGWMVTPMLWLIILAGIASAINVSVSTMTLKKRMVGHIITILTTALVSLVVIQSAKSVWALEERVNISEFILMITALMTMLAAPHIYFFIHSLLTSLGNKYSNDHADRDHYSAPHQQPPTPSPEPIAK